MATAVFAPTHISKQIVVQAFQYPNGSWKVVYEDGSVAHLTDEAFKEMFEVLVSDTPGGVAFE